MGLEEIAQSKATIKEKAPEFDLDSLQPLMDAYDGADKLIQAPADNPNPTPLSEIMLQNIDGIARACESSDTVAKYVKLLTNERLVSNPRLALKYANGVWQFSRVTSAEHLSALIDLIGKEGYRSSPETVRPLAESIKGAIRQMQSNKLVIDIFTLMGNHQSDPGKALDVANSIKKVVDYGGREESTKLYVEFCSKLDPDRFESHIYDNFAEYFVSISKQFRAVIRDVREVTFQYLVDEADFLNQQTSQTIYPMARTLVALGEEYKDRIEAFDDYTKQTLATAFTYVDHLSSRLDGKALWSFYDALKTTLDTYPEAVGEWAQGLVKDLQTEEKEGLLRAA